MKLPARSTLLTHARALRLRQWARRVFLLPVYAYRYTLSAFIGRTCRHMPSCSEYMIEAVETHGIWPGGWMGFARLCRCRPGGTAGLDYVCEAIAPQARWYTPWRYGLWRSTYTKGP